jgi:CRP-like cAMP-binding protein
MRFVVKKEGSPYNALGGASKRSPRETGGKRNRQLPLHLGGMMAVLQDLLNTANRLRQQGALLEALKVYRLVLEAAPLDFDLRMTVGDVLLSMDHVKAALTVYKAAAEHDIKAGNPLRAMVAIKVARRNGMDTTPLIETLAAEYAAGSPALGRSVKLAPSDYSAKVRDDIALDYPVDRDPFVAETALLAANTSTIQNYPPLVPPLAIFSTLDKHSFLEVFSRLELRRFRAETPIVRQGEPGDTLFFIARGEVSVIREKDGEAPVQLARLGGGSLFGEMALLSDEPRSAGVICDTDVDALMLTRSDVEALSREIPNVSGAMARFMRERLINNLLSTNPLFAPFDETLKKQLLSKFKGHDVPAGTVFLEQGDAGRGLYVILNGHAEITKNQDGETVHLADLGPGDIAGEMSLVNEAPVSATACTKTPSTLLFLARELFLPLIEAVPSLKSYFAELARTRGFDTDIKVAAGALHRPEADESESVDIALDEDDIVFI